MQSKKFRGSGRKRVGKVRDLKETLVNWAKRFINNFGTFKTSLNSEGGKAWALSRAAETGAGRVRTQ